jgi:hypothetical protein
MLSNPQKWGLSYALDSKSAEYVFSVVKLM